MRPMLIHNNIIKKYLGEEYKISNLYIDKSYENNIFQINFFVHFFFFMLVAIGILILIEKYKFKKKIIN